MRSVMALAAITLLSLTPVAHAALVVLSTPAQEAACIDAGGKVVLQSDGKTKVCVMPPPPPGTAAPH